MMKCPKCNGKGNINLMGLGHSAKCLECNGTGKIKEGNEYK